MIERLTIASIHTLRDAKAATPEVSEKPRLAMKWVLDPATKKPVAHWIVEPEQTEIALTAMASAA